MIDKTLIGVGLLAVGGYLAFKGTSASSTTGGAGGGVGGSFVAQKPNFGNNVNGGGDTQTPFTFSVEQSEPSFSSAPQTKKEVTSSAPPISGAVQTRLPVVGNDSGQQAIFNGEQGVILSSDGKTPIASTTRDIFHPTQSIDTTTKKESVATPTPKFNLFGGFTSNAPNLIGINNWGLF